MIMWKLAVINCNQYSYSCEFVKAWIDGAAGWCTADFPVCGFIFL